MPRPPQDDVRCFTGPVEPPARGALYKDGAEIPKSGPEVALNLNRPIEPPCSARLVTRSELARIAGVSPAAITKACKNSLAPAVVGKLVDLEATCTLSYLAKSGASPTTVRPTEADLAALRAQHGAVYRVCLPDLEEVVR